MENINIFDERTNDGYNVNAAVFYSNAIEVYDTDNTKKKMEINCKYTKINVDIRSKLRNGMDTIRLYRRNWKIVETEMINSNKYNTNGCNPSSNILAIFYSHPHSVQ